MRELHTKRIKYVHTKCMKKLFTIRKQFYTIFILTIFMQFLYTIVYNLTLHISYIFVLYILCYKGMNLNRRQFLRNCMSSTFIHFINSSCSFYVLFIQINCDFCTQMNAWFVGSNFNGRFLADLARFCC